MKFLAALGLCFLSACAAIPPTSLPEVAVPEAGKPVQAEVAPPVEPPAQALSLADWSELAAWGEGEQIHAWEAFQLSCSTLKRQAAWASVCESASSVPAQPEQVRRFFESHFLPYRVSNPDKSRLGMITGYYEPLLNGSKTRTSRFRYPVYAPPSDLLTVDLAAVYPELKGMRLRGRLQGSKIVPYYNRAEIENGSAPIKGTELYWVDDAVDLFFLQIQGSGKIRLPSGELARVGYADQNGFPYKSIGKALVERGELTLDKASMQGIKDWAKRNPGKLNELLNTNASYVFFRELPNPLGGPLGAMGLPLTEGRSIAIDPRSIPLGAPVFLMTTWPNENRPLNRLMMAQDTGGAIKGAVRADLFWGFGHEAGKLAGSMKQNGRMWVLLPKGYVF
jgi:membrane-bound lytic murein transglycosylase A